jgi:hypothetical protein
MQARWVKNDDEYQRTDFRKLPLATRLETGSNIEKSLQKKDVIVILHELFGLGSYCEHSGGKFYDLPP